MLLGILFLYFHHQHLTGVYTFSLTALYDTAPKIYSDPAYGPTIATLLFFAFFFAFAIKVPRFPFHTWLPDAAGDRARAAAPPSAWRACCGRWELTASSVSRCRSSPAC